MSLVFPDKIAHGPRLKAGSVGEYYDGPLFTGKCTPVYASTCAHCQHITEWASKKDMVVDVCRKCMRLVCERCSGSPCTPQEAWCEQIEREALRKKIEIDGWGCY